MTTCAGVRVRLRQIGGDGSDVEAHITGDENELSIGPGCYVLNEVVDLAQVALGRFGMTGC